MKREFAIFNFFRTAFLLFLAIGVAYGDSYATRGSVAFVYCMFGVAIFLHLVCGMYSPEINHMASEDALATMFEEENIEKERERRTRPSVPWRILPLAAAFAYQGLLMPFLFMMLTQAVQELTRQLDFEK